MEDPQALKLFQEVLAKTKVNKMQWEPTASESEYFSLLPSGYTLLVSQQQDSWGEPIPREFALVLRKGEQDLLRVTSDVDGVGSEGLSELYEFARRHALSVNATVDQVLGDLAKL
jgi:hypothetical protein